MPKGIYQHKKGWHHSLATRKKLSHQKLGYNNPMFGLFREKHHNWKGGFSLSMGYLRDCKTKQYIHKLKGQQKINRRLRKDEVVHHINGIKTDNRLQNLLVCTKGEHCRIHRKLSWKNKYEMSKL